MPRRLGMRYCPCGTRLAADNPSDQCLACVRQEQAHLQQPPELPLAYWLTDRFDDAFAAQHIGLVAAAYRYSPFHRHPISQEQLGSWFGMSQPEVSRIESGPPIRHLDRLAHWARMLKVPPQLLWFDLPGQRRAVLTSRDRLPAWPEPAASHEPPADGHGQPTPSDERRDQVHQDHGIVSLDHLAALLEAEGGLPAAGLRELLAGSGGLAAIGLLPAGSASPAGTSPSVLSQLSALLVTPSGTRSLTLGDGRYRLIAPSGEVLPVVIDRRTLLEAAGLALPIADAETTRHGLLRAMGDTRATIDEWQTLVRNRWSPFNGSPAERFFRLVTDMAALREAFEHERSETGQNELRMVGAALATLTALVVADLGDLPACRGWVRTARHLADASGDLHTRLWVRGKEVVMGLYQDRPVHELLHLAEESVAIGEAQGPPRTSAWPALTGATAQILAVAGRRDEARAALDQARDSFSALPDGVRDGSLVNWSEHSLRFTEGFVYTYLDEYRHAEAAQDAARRLYPPEYQGGLALVELLRALCQVRMGDTAVGVTHARETVGRLPSRYRVHTVIDLGRKVLDAVPGEERRTDEAVALRGLVGAA